MSHNEDKKNETYTNFEDGVVCFRSYKNSVLVAEEWFKNGKLNRDEEIDLPSLIWFYENGNKRQEVWCKDGLPYRKNGKVAWLEYRENGKRKYGSWYYENGNKHEEVWIRDDNEISSNPDQPYRIEYYENGKVKANHWNPNGRLYSESFCWKPDGNCEIFAHMRAV